VSNPDFERLLQFSDTEVEISQLALIDSGFSSEVYAADDVVVKILGHEHPTARGAHQHADVLYGEQDRITGYMGPDNVATAQFVVGHAQNGEYRISLVQPRVSGILIANALADAESHESIAGYFEKGLSMYSRTHQIPDLACIEGRYFNPLIDPNTQVLRTGEGFQPVLVDTTFGRLQRKAIIGKFFHSQIAWGVKRALNGLD